jgi:hypothetical protein
MAARLLRVALLLLAAAASRAAADPIEFLIAEHPGREVHGDSYVLLLEDPADLAHARELIATKGAAGAAIVVAKIAAGADGLNRDVRAPSAPPWSWHVTEFDAFADNTIELCDGWPGHVEQDVEGWIDNTDGTICFWSYTVVEELPEPGAAQALAAGFGALLVLARARRVRASHPS